MTAPRRHSYQVVRNRAQNPRYISREELALERKRALAEVQLEEQLENQRQAAEKNHQPAIMTRQGLIDAGLLVPK